MARDPRLDALRAAAAVAVVLIHTAAPVVVAGAGSRDGGWWCAHLVDALCRWSVPVFVMVSGALALAVPSDRAPLRFYAARLGRLLPPLLFWTAFYLPLSIRDGGLDAAGAAHALLAGLPYYHLWYLYMALGLVLATPFLRAVLAAASPAGRRWFVAAALLAGVASLWTGTGTTFLALAVPYVGLYCAGYLVYAAPSTGRHSPWPWLGLAALAGAGVAALTAALLPRIGVRAIDLGYAFVDPLVMLAAFAMVRAALAAPLSGARPWVASVARLSLGIYVLHPFFLRELQRVRCTAFTVHPAVGIPLTAALAFGLSLGTAALLARVPGVRRVVV